MSAVHRGRGDGLGATPRAERECVSDYGPSPGPFKFKFESAQVNLNRPRLGGLQSEDCQWSTVHSLKPLEAICVPVDSPIVTAPTPTHWQRTRAT